MADPFDEAFKNAAKNSRIINPSMASGPEPNNPNAPINQLFDYMEKGMSQSDRAILDFERAKAMGFAQAGAKYSGIAGQIAGGIGGASMEVGALPAAIVGVGGAMIGNVAEQGFKWAAGMPQNYPSDPGSTLDERVFDSALRSAIPAVGGEALGYGTGKLATQGIKSIANIPDSLAHLSTKLMRNVPETAVRTLSDMAEKTGVPETLEFLNQDFTKAGQTLYGQLFGKASSELGAAGAAVEQSENALRAVNPDKNIPIGDLQDDIDLLRNSVKGSPMEQIMKNAVPGLQKGGSVSHMTVPELLNLRKAIGEKLPTLFDLNAKGMEPFQQLISQIRGKATNLVEREGNSELVGAWKAARSRYGDVAGQSTDMATLLGIDPSRTPRMNAEGNFNTMGVIDKFIENTMGSRGGLNAGANANIEALAPGAGKELDKLGALAAFNTERPLAMTNRTMAIVAPVAAGLKTAQAAGGGNPGMIGAGAILGGLVDPKIVSRMAIAAGGINSLASPVAGGVTRVAAGVAGSYAPQMADEFSDLYKSLMSTPQQK